MIGAIDSYEHIDLFLTRAEVKELHKSHLEGDVIHLRSPESRVRILLGKRHQSLEQHDTLAIALTPDLLETLESTGAAETVYGDERRVTLHREDKLDKHASLVLENLKLFA